MPRSNSASGQSLVEVVVGLALAILVLGGLINAVVTSLRNSNFAKNQAQATKLSQQIMEQVRIVRDQVGWETFQTYGNSITDLCYSINTIGGISLSVNTSCTSQTISTSFKYLLKMKLPSATDACDSNCRRVTVSVSWADAACSGGAFCHKSELISYLSKWK